MRRYFQTTVFLVLCAIGPVMGQDTGHGHSEEDHGSDHDSHSEFRPHKLALITGYGFLSGAIDTDGEETSQIIPVIGLDYEYWFNHRIGAGIHNDLELTSYTVELDHQTYVDRSYAFVTSLLFLYEPMHNWTLYAGPGYEFESHHNFPLLRIGTDITKSFEDGWGVALVLAYDIKEINSAITLAIGVSKRFGK